MPLKIRLYPEDADGTGEKILYSVWNVLLFGGLTVCYLFFWQVLPSEMGKLAHQASKGWHIVGTICFVLSVVWLVLAVKDWVGFNSKADGALKALVFAALTAISWLSYIGWNI